MWEEMEPGSVSFWH